MKIIITVASYYPAKNGVQAVTQYHAEGLANRGHNVTVVTSMLPNIKQEEIYNGVKIIRVDAYNKHLIHIGNKKEYRKLIVDITRDADCLINVCLQSYSADWVLDILDNINCKKILYMHGMHDFKWYKKDFFSISDFNKKVARDIWWRTFYTKQSKKIRKYDVITHLHEKDTAYKYFSKNNFGKNIILENAVDDSFFLESLKIIKEAPEQYFICIANYDKRKNQKKAMKAFYFAQTSNYSLVFIGSKKNKYYNELIDYKEKLDKKYGYKDIKILTEIPRNQVCRYLKFASGFLMTSTWEAFPISIIESMAAGIPFISTDVGIIKYLPGGIVVKNINEMSYWIEMIINNPLISRKIGEVGREYAKKDLRKDNQINKLNNIISIE